MVVNNQMQAGNRYADRTWHTRNLEMGKVIEVFPEHGTVHVAMEYGNIVRHALVITGAGGTREGIQSLPQVLNSTAWKLDREGVSISDEYLHSDERDTFAIVGYLYGMVTRPFAILIPPNFHEASFPETNLRIERHAGDSYELTYALDAPTSDTLRKLMGTQALTDTDNEDNPSPIDYPRQVAWERVFPDNRRLAAPDTTLQQEPPAFEPGSPSVPSAYRLGLETYEAVGYGYSGQLDQQLAHSNISIPPPPTTSTGQFPEQPLSAQPTTYPDGIPQINRRALGASEKGKLNYDTDSHPWKRHRENKTRFARGMRFNQRWGSNVELTRSGDVRLLAEGMNQNVYPDLETDAKTETDPVAMLLYQNPDWGNLYLMARSETRMTAKGSWAYHRKRWQWGGRLEDVDTNVDATKENDAADVRRWGQSRIRTQRLWEALSRKDATLGGRASVSILAGAVDDTSVYADGVWSRSDPGQGGDFARYQDRLAWRNPDSDEGGNIVIRSVRGKLSDFGSDKPTRTKDQGGEILISTEPLEGDNAPITIQAIAARNNAAINLTALAGQVDPSGTGASINFNAQSPAGSTTIEISDTKGLVSARTGGGGASAGMQATSGGDNATASLIADTQGDNALVDIEAKTEQGINATVQVFAKPAGGTGLLDLEAISPETAIAKLIAGSSANAQAIVQSSGSVNIEADGSAVNILAAQIISLLSHLDIDLQAGGDILVSAVQLLKFTGSQVTIQGGQITLDGPVNIVGGLSVNGVAVTVP